MNYRKKIGLLVVFTMIMAIIGYLLTEIVRLNFFDSLDESIGIPVFLFSLTLFFIFFIFLFIKEGVFNYWKKFAKIFLPIAIIIIAITPTQQGGFVGIDKELATWWLVGLFLISSFGIIIWKSIELRKKSLK
ncbi:MAG: hypothetical protein ACD_7C00494G0001 [uncultured bacterium]|nr:MAG: hypothetical protein ACD_7C00494G0001 [uncultured bacterium]KKP68368.1 MAG: hypothetical protein UR66_C0006G0069 [Candidatus Moranbacteria bacterium GW2011_GWE1_35_17]KKP82135.1 MAG: hypothetical protein UR82_C0043G0006 [Candidatus Moranbacteria bacterium GW2011_GWF1_35_5]